jgi:hypothetical protein
MSKIFTSALLAICFVAVPAAPAQFTQQESPLQLPIVKRVGKAALNFANVLTGSAKAWWDAADEITRVEYAMTCSAVVTAFEAKQLLIVGKMDLAFSVEKKLSNWRGAVEVGVWLPCTADIVVDLSQLRTDSVTWDVQRHILQVRLPGLRVGSVEAHLSKEKVSKSYPGWARFAWLDSGSANELANQIRKIDWPSMARAEADKQLPQYTGAACKALEQHLEAVLRLAIPDVVVRVTPSGD